MRLSVDDDADDSIDVRDNGDTVAGVDVFDVTNFPNVKCFLGVEKDQ